MAASLRTSSSSTTSRRAGSCATTRTGILSRTDVAQQRLLAVEIEFACGGAKNLGTRGGVGDRVIQPVDRGLIRKLTLMADKRAVARPHQPVRASDTEQFACIVL